ncbi:DivIVA domain-containing protein [Planosporangium thailandense]|uniref:DivIVA domain-containing protein n=1 Tax=Planosporangium thailandense TaxID=765197 RepID=A0ABX0XVJ9_9ACTN|nr:DivIVA domain-containing protein [Planosporangium thailandense]NJC69342.1 DivIVA domain-containing protein [Planosporangium thailandense]
MGQLLLLTIGALIVGAIGFGVAVLVTGSDPGLTPVDPDGRALPLPADRPLVESDLARVRFDTAVRGYRMDQVDAALRRAAYDLGYKGELVGVLEAEVEALRAGRHGDADKLRAARAAALNLTSPGAQPAASGEPAADTDPGTAGVARETPDREDAATEVTVTPAEPTQADPDAAGRADTGDRTRSHRAEEMRLP